MSQRTWCPAIAADPATLEAAAEGSPQRFHSPERPASPKNKGREAAKFSAEAAKRSVRIVEKVHESQKYSSRVALSAMLNAGTREVLPSDPFDPHLASAQEKVSTGKPALCRNPEHVKYMWARDADLPNLSLCDAEMPTVADVETLSQHAKFSDVQSLSVVRSCRGTNSLPLLVAALPPNKIEMLRIEDNVGGFGAPRGEDPSATALETVGKFISNTTSLKTLRLPKCGLLSSGAAGLVPSLLANGSILSLDLSGNEIGRSDEAGPTAIAQLLQEDKFLLDVCLDENDFTAAHAKQLFDAVSSSNTRVATPPADPLPETEEYTDELPPEEEKPTVEIGLPAEETEKPAADGAAPAEEKAAEDAQPPPQEREGTPAPEKEEGDDEAEEQQNIEEVPTKEEPPVVEDTAVPEDEEAMEERQRLEDERLEAARKAWEEKMNQYVWDPQRQHFSYSESVARREILKEHISTTTEMKGIEKAARTKARTEQLERERQWRARRSGWSHLKSISVENNPIGSEGAKALALMLRHMIPLTQEEIDKLEEEAAEARKLAEEAEAKAKEERERIEAEAREAREAEEKERLAAAEAEKAAQELQDNEDEPTQQEETEAPAAAEVPGNDDKEPQEEREEEAAASADDEADETATEKATKASNVKKEKPGVQTIEVVNVSRCGIGAIGLKALCATIKENTPSLRALLLRKNKFGIRHAELPVPEDFEGDEPPKPVRIEVADWISPGVAALSEVLSVNKSLAVLDLSFNSLCPCNLSLLFQGLKTNMGLTTLLLDGNKFDAACFMELLAAISSNEQCVLSTLGLNTCGLGDCVTREAAKLLCRCASITALDLSINSLRDENFGIMAEGLTPPTDVTPDDRLQMPRLKAISLAANELSGHCADALCKLLSAHASLRSISLRDNPSFGDAGFAAVAESLVNHHALESLDAHRTGITRLEPLSRILASVSFLSHVDFGDNEIDVAEAVGFVEAVRQSPSLKSFILWGREETSDRDLFAAAFETVRTCPSLVHIDFGQGLPGISGAIPQNALDATADHTDSLMDDTEKLELMCFVNRTAASNRL